MNKYLYLLETFKIIRLNKQILHNQKKMSHPFPPHPINKDEIKLCQCRGTYLGLVEHTHKSQRCFRV